MKDQSVRVLKCGRKLRPFWRVEVFIGGAMGGWIPMPFATFWTRDGAETRAQIERDHRNAA